MNRTSPPDSAWVQQLLVREGMLERRGDYLVQPLAGSASRADAIARRTFLVWHGKTVLFHVTVGKGLRAVLRRHVGFAGQFPNLTCHPLFLLQRDGVDIAGREYFEGRNLEDALRRGELDAATAAATIDNVLAQLAVGERTSTPAAALKELATFGDDVLAMGSWSDADRLFLREIALRFLRDHLGDGPFRRRWTNGDFIAKNVLVGPASNVRVVDYEFATRTHFFADDCLRFQGHSAISENVKRGVRTLQRPPTRFETLYTLLNHARLSERVLSGEIARAEVAAVAARVAQLVATENGRKSLFLLSPRAGPRVAVAAGSPVEAKIYWSESGAFAEEASACVNYAPGKPAQLVVELPALAPVRHVRIDPADRVGLVHVVAILVRSLATLEPLWQANGSAELKAIEVGGTALSLDSEAGLDLLSTGDDPWFVLPPLDRVTVEPLRVELSLCFDDARAGVERAAAEIVALREALRAPAPMSPVDVKAVERRSRRAARRKARR